eukprot:1160177-Pelagomonas_calceolata.AAC.3
MEKCEKAPSVQIVQVEKLTDVAAPLLEMLQALTLTWCRSSTFRLCLNSSRFKGPIKGAAQKKLKCLFEQTVAALKLSKHTNCIDFHTV